MIVHGIKKFKHLSGKMVSSVETSDMSFSMTSLLPMGQGGSVRRHFCILLSFGDPRSVVEG